jgi:AraC-like DNA-binding protein
MAVVYSTSDVHPRDGLAYWVEVVTKGFARLAVTPNAGSPFRASVRTGLLGALSVSVYDCDRHICERCAPDIARAADDDVFLCLQQAGTSLHIQDERIAVMGPGTLCLVDPRRPFTGHTGDGKVITVKLPRQALEARTGNVASLACRIVDGRKPVAGLALGFLSMLPERIEALDAAAAEKVAQLTIDLVMLSFAAESEARVALSSRRAVTLTFLKAAIEARLPDPELKPAAAAAAVGISVRYANALLADEDSCLERYIIGRRLERCRRALEDPAQAHRRIGEIAFGWGFSDLSHFVRRFKAEFGCSPGEYRKRSPGIPVS